MKKILTILCVIMVISLVGCSKSDVAEISDEESTDVEMTGTAGDVSEDISEIETLDDELDVSELDDLDSELDELSW